MRFRLNDNKCSGNRSCIERPYDYPYEPRGELGGLGRPRDYPRPQQKFYYPASSKGGHGD